MKIKITVTTGSTAVVSAITFDPVPPTSTAPASRVFAQTGSLGRLLGSMPDGTPINLQYHTDAHGNVTALSDAYGNLSTAYYTDAWGNVIAGSSAQNPYVNAGNHGYWQDADLGLNYVRARWLNPETGTWLSVDPIQGEPRYNYAHNSPTVRVDPSGMASQNLTAAQAAKILDRGLDPASIAAQMGQLRREMQKMISGAMRKRMPKREIAAVRIYAAKYGPKLTPAETKLLAEIEFSNAHYVRNVTTYAPRKHGPSAEEKKYIDEQADIFNHEAEGAWRRGAFAWETGSYLGDVGAFAKGELLAVPRGLWSAFNTFGDTMLGIYNWPARKEFIPPTLTSSTAWKQRGNQALKFAHGFNFFDQPDLESSGDSFFNDELIAAAVAPKVAPYFKATGRAGSLWLNETLQARRVSASGIIEGPLESVIDSNGHVRFRQATQPPKTPLARILTELRRPEVNGKPMMELPGTNPLKLARKLSPKELGNLMRIFGNEVGLWRRGSDYFLTSGEARALPGPWPDAEFIYDGHGHPLGTYMPSPRDYKFVEARYGKAGQLGLNVPMDSRIIVHQNATGPIADFIGRHFGEYFVPRDYSEVVYGLGGRTKMPNTIEAFVQFPGEKPRWVTSQPTLAQFRGEGPFLSEYNRFLGQFTRAELKARNMSGMVPEGLARDERP